MSYNKKMTIVKNCCPYFLGGLQGLSFQGVYFLGGIFSSGSFLKNKSINTHVFPYILAFRARARINKSRKNSRVLLLFIRAQIIFVVIRMFFIIKNRLGTYQFNKFISKLFSDIYNEFTIQYFGSYRSKKSLKMLQTYNSYKSVKCE